METVQKIAASATAMAVLEVAKAEHRAEVAERALKICLIDNLYCCDCDTRFYTKCKATDKDREKCAMLDFDDYIQQAEKELVEERKDD